MISVALACLASLVPMPLLAQAAPAGDPTKAEVPLPSFPGWNASLVYDNGATGIWTVGGIKAFPQFGCPEIFGLDDKGHCTILFSYSGKWTPFQTVEDGEWLGALQVVDLDPRRPGEEIYTGGKKGNLFQIKSHREGGFDTNIIARFPAQEIHTLVAGDLRPSRPGNELILYTLLGDVYEIRPKTEAGSGFDAVFLQTVSGRVRQAMILPAKPGEAPWIAGTCRSGEFLLHRLNGDKLDEQVVLKEPMGLGRMDLRRGAPGDPLVVYISRDDGVILRVEQKANGKWDREVIYAGPQGPRGVAAGRFDADPSVETVAVFGYSKLVQLLSRAPGKPWRAEDVFEDRDKGHWLSTLEVDGRNGTDELVASGYGGRIVLLSRPPGYGLSGIPIAPPAQKPAAAPKEVHASRSADGALRVALRGDPAAGRNLSPLSYRGGFEGKALVYETLVERDAEGRIVGALAQDWSVLEGGRVWRFTLRPDARFHDGAPADAEAVVLHFRRWVGLPEHAWIGASRRIRSVTAVGEREVRVELDKPYALLPDLCAFNPAAIQAPSAVSQEGTFRAPVGSGPYRWLGPVDGAPQSFLVERTVPDAAGSGLTQLVYFNDPDPDVEVRALEDGRVDVVADGGSRSLPRDQVARLGADPRFRVVEGVGSAVRYLAFEAKKGPTSKADVRRRVASAIVREDLVRACEDGRAIPCASLFAPCLAIWPKPRPGVARAANAAGGAVPPLRLIASSADAIELVLARAIERQLSTAGVAVRVTALDGAAYRAALANGEFDLRFGESWGLPYDPFLTLGSLFHSRTPTPSAVNADPLVSDLRLDAMFDQAAAEPDQEKRSEHYARIQKLVDDEALVVPLYVPNRIAVTRMDLAGLQLDPNVYRLRLETLGKVSAREPVAPAPATAAR